MGSDEGIGLLAALVLAFIYHQVCPLQLVTSLKCFIPCSKCFIPCSKLPKLPT